MPQTFQEILKSNGILEPIESTSSKEPSGTGENFCSKIEFAKITFKNGCREPLHLFVKKSTDSKEYNEILEECQHFGKEAQFFTEYLAVAREYCSKMDKEELLDIYPKCYYGDEKLIVFENLVEGGFQLLNDKIMHDFDTARIALTNLAKHHAISHSLIVELGGADKFFQKFPKLKFQVFAQNSWRRSIEPSFVNMLETNIKLLESSRVEGSNEAANKLKLLRGNIYPDILKTLENKKGDFLVINHGDYCDKNMMFKIDRDTNKVSQEIAVDYQLTTYSSPCNDLSYYLFTTVKPEVRKARLDDMVQVYLSALLNTGKELGHEINYTKEMLQKDLCNYFKFGFWVGFCFFSAPETDVKLEVKKGQSMEEYFKEFDGLQMKWITENPEKCEASAKKLIQMVDEYGMLEKGGVMHPN